jgi:iron complex transport system ATP-binding protein
MGAILSCKGLSAGYGKKVVVSGLDIEVCKGEILTMIGPNGAGKTTVLKTIAAQLPAIDGGAQFYFKSSAKDLSQ